MAGDERDELMEHEVTTFAGCVNALRQPDLRQSLYDEAGLMMERALVNLHGPEHRARRSAEASMFRKDIFLDYETNVLPRTMQETFAPFLAAGKGDLVDLGYRVMLNLTVDFTGIDRPERSPEETGELLRLLRDFSLAPALGQSLDDIEPKRRRIAAAMDDFARHFLRPSIERRRALIAKWQAGELEREALPRDVLTALLLNEDKLQLTDQDWVQEGIFYTLAGAHTTIHSLTHAVHELLQWLEAHPEDKVRLREDPFFIQQCVYESVRLHPSSPVARRRALCPVDIGEEAQLDPGEEIVIDLRKANHDGARFGADADRFNPHRSVSGTFRYGLSMGDGVHACIGRHLAIGVDPKPGADPETHQYGVVPLIVKGLLQAGVRPDPDETAEKDEAVTRITWLRYPVILRPEEALI
jgi:cytochrome P450